MINPRKKTNIEIMGQELALGSQKEIAAANARNSRNSTKSTCPKPQLVKVIFMMRMPLLTGFPKLPTISRPC